MANENYDPSITYEQFDSADLSSCGCAVPGLVTLTDCDGNAIGLLTPNDAETYQNGTIEVPLGYTKVFNPISGTFLGIMTIAEAMEYITYLLDNNIS